MSTVDHDVDPNALQIHQIVNVPDGRPGMLFTFLSLNVYAVLCRIANPPPSAVHTSALHESSTDIMISGDTFFVANDKRFLKRRFPATVSIIPLKKNFDRTFALFCPTPTKYLAPLLLSVLEMIS